MRGGLALAALLGALTAPIAVFAPQRAPAVVQTTIDPATVGAWLDQTVGGNAGRVQVAHPTDAACQLLVLAVADARPGDTSGLNLAVRRDPASGVACQRWQGAITDRLRQADRSPPSIRAGDEVVPLGHAGRLALALAAALIGALLGLMCATFVTLQGHTRRRVGLLFAIALGARLLWPDRLAMVYFGYELLAHAVHLDSLPRYGPGSTALWSMFLGSATDDPGVVLRVHDLLGAATVAIWALSAVRATRRDAALWWVGLPLALSPLFVRDHGSESLHVGALWALSMACYALAAGRQWGLAGLAVAAAGCALATLFRADVAPLALTTALLFYLLAGGRLGWPTAALRGRAMALALALGGSLALSGVLVLERIGRDLDRANLPQLATLASDLPGHLLLDNVLMRPELFPLAGWLAVLVWIARGRSQQDVGHTWLLMPAVALAWLLPYYADFNETSMLRLQVPAATLFTIGAGVLAMQLTDQATRPRPVAMSWLLAFLLSAGLTLPTCLQTTNAHRDDELIAAAAAALPTDRPFWLVTRSYAEGPARDLHLHLPTWRFQAPWRAGRVMGIGAWQRAVAAGQAKGVQVWYLQGFRCWMHRQGRGLPSRLHPACAAARAKVAGWPLIHMQAANLGDSRTFDLYGSSATLEVGLWPVSGGGAANGQTGQSAF